MINVDMKLNGQKGRVPLSTAAARCFLDIQKLSSSKQSGIPINL